MSPPAQWSVARRCWAVLLTGIPFAVFKIGGGVIAYDDVHHAVGLAIVAWGVLDVIFNVVSLFLFRKVSPCTLSNLGRWLDAPGDEGHRERFALAVDTLLSFAIVATVIWFRRLGSLPPALVRIWEVAVIANVMGAGIERVWTERVGAARSRA